MPSASGPESKSVGRTGVDVAPCSDGESAGAFSVNAFVKHGWASIGSSSLWRVSRSPVFSLRVGGPSKAVDLSQGIFFSLRRFLGLRTLERLGAEAGSVIGQKKTNRETTVGVLHCPLGLLKGELPLL